MMPGGAVSAAFGTVQTLRMDRGPSLSLSIPH